MQPNLTQACNKTEKESTKRFNHKQNLILICKCFQFRRPTSLQTSKDILSMLVSKKNRIYIYVAGFDFISVFCCIPDYATSKVSLLYACDLAKTFTSHSFTQANYSQDSRHNKYATVGVILFYFF